MYEQVLLVFKKKIMKQAPVFRPIDSGKDSITGYI